MLTVAEFQELLTRPEGPTLDFKRSAYDLREKLEKIAFVKDVIALANTPRDCPAYLVLGVESHSDGSKELFGLTSMTDDAECQQLLSGWATPVPHVACYPMRLDDKVFGVVQIDPVRSGPFMASRDHGNGLDAGKVYVRRGSRNSCATGDELQMIASWFAGAGASSLVLPPPQAWATLLELMSGLDPSRRYILLSDLPRTPLSADLAALAAVAWHAVVDCDPASDSGGLLSAVRTDIEEHRAVHLTTIDSDLSVLSRDSTTWIFARGLEGRVDTQPASDYRQWLQRAKPRLDSILAHLASQFSPDPVTCLALLYRDPPVYCCAALLDALTTTFGETLTIVGTTSPGVAVRSLTDPREIPCVAIPLVQLTAGMRSLLDADSSERPQLRLPSSSGAPIALDHDTQMWIQEELELLHLDCLAIRPEASGVQHSYYRGAEISWRDLDRHVDQDRDVTPNIRIQLQRELDSRRTVRLNIYHEPGAGGTTVAKRLLWESRTSAVCALLRRSSAASTAERLLRLHSLTGLPCLILVEGATIAERELSELYAHVSRRRVPAVLLHVIRVSATREQRQGAFFVRTSLTPAETDRFVSAYAQAVPVRTQELNRAANGDAKLRTAFLFGLTAFDKEFLGLESYVASRLSAATKSQRLILALLSLCHHYSQRALPAQLFAPELGIPRSQSVRLASTLTRPQLDLVLEQDPGYWRPIHDLVSHEVLVQTLTPAGGDRRSWKQSLSELAGTFINLCAGASTRLSEDLRSMLERLFVLRDSADLIGTERAGDNVFSVLLQDIPSTNGRASILRQLVDHYPDEPHYWAHLGRFLSIEMGDSARALECVDRAIALRDADAVLHHMRGMILRQQVYAAVEGNTPVAETLAPAQASCDSFERAHECNPEDEHALISHAQLLLKLLESSSRRPSRSIADVLRDPGTPALVREAPQRIEELLHTVRMIRGTRDANEFETRSRARLDGIYGRFEDVLTALHDILQRKGSYRPPIRRQLVWTYLARRQRDWDLLTRSDIERVHQLLEENLTQESYNDADMRLWLRVARRLEPMPHIDSVIERVAYWQARTGSIDAQYYSYAVHAIAALSGSQLSRTECERGIDACRRIARNRKVPAHSVEWLGNGLGVRRLVHYQHLGVWDSEMGFWKQRERLARISGRIAKLDGRQSGWIELDGGIQAFFVPIKSGFVIGKDENTKVTCLVGFTYEGPRAWEVQRAE